VQFGLFQVHPDQHVAKLPLDAERAGRVQADLGAIGGAEATLGPGQGE
jgi:hypothetical protein